GAPLEIEDLKLDPPQAGEVRVDVAACAICHSDIHFAEGAWGGRLPAVYGHEAAGIVESVGVGVEAVRPGDRVVVSLIRTCGRCFFCTRGEPYLCEAEFPIDARSRLQTMDGEPVHVAMNTAAFAEQVVVDVSQLAVVPDVVPLDVASLLACGVITGLGAVVSTAQVPVGSSVVVIGTGGVGLNSVQGALICGAQPIVALDISPAKLEAATAFGATHTFDPAACDPAAEVRALTGGRGADYVFVTVGSTHAVEQGLGLLRSGGTLVVVGLPPSGATFGVVAVDFAGEALRILGSNMGSTKLGIAVPALVDLYRGGRLKLDELISARFPLERINEAIAAVGDGATLRNVIVFGPE
ncbi:MAG TPA: zinc-binding dehydrogenase, partial [Gaiellaceae bacterium]|nr:zinc-binding dehydrogenase [Gaiellaceae bacterium]